MGHPLGGKSMEGDIEKLNQVARVAALAAQLMLGNGGETYRAEETARHICRAFGYESEVIAFPTGIMLSIGGEKSLIARVTRRRVDFSKIDRVNAISRELACGARPRSGRSRHPEIAGRKRPFGLAICAGGAQFLGSRSPP